MGDKQSKQKEAYEAKKQSTERRKSGVVKPIGFKRVKSASINRHTGEISWTAAMEEQREEFM
jgi:hypothetical protein